MIPGCSLHSSLQPWAPLYPSRLLQPTGAAWPAGVPWPPTRLTGAGVGHHGGQVPPLAHVHGHEGRVLADDVAGPAGVHGARLVAAAGPCGGRGWSHCVDSKFSLMQRPWKLEGRLDRQWSPSLGLNKSFKSGGCQRAN